jgi:DNA gyrase subunit B
MMPELVERGHLYLAQPPLFRVGKGRNATYLKDEAGFSEFLMKRICETKKIKTSDDGGFLEKEKLYAFLGSLVDYDNVIRRLERRGYSGALVQFLIQEGAVNRSFLQDEERMRELAQTVVSVGYKMEQLLKDEEHNVFELILSPQDNGTTRVTIGWDLITSPDLQKGIVLWKTALLPNKAPFGVYENGHEAFSVTSKEELLSLLLREAKKGLFIQRYKGLGEMNPDQLWETTMDAEKRTLVKIKVEDMFEAHDIFTVLMGDEVEQRRNFIENNAVDVRRLDI